MTGRKNMFHLHGADGAVAASALLANCNPKWKDVTKRYDTILLKQSTTKWTPFCVVMLEMFPKNSKAKVTKPLEIFKFSKSV